MTYDARKTHIEGRRSAGLDVPRAKAPRSVPPAPAATPVVVPAPEPDLAELERLTAPAATPVTAPSVAATLVATKPETKPDTKAKPPGSR